MIKTYYVWPRRITLMLIYNPSQWGIGIGTKRADSHGPWRTRYLFFSHGHFGKVGW